MAHQTRSLYSLALGAVASAVLWAAPATSHAQNLYISSFDNGSVGEYNGTTGAAVSDFTTISPGFGVEGVAVSGGTLYVPAPSGTTVREYDATAGGATTGSISPSGLDGPVGVAVSGNDIYVSNVDGDTVGGYNITTGDPLPGFTTITGLNEPLGLTVSGGYLYVADTDNHRVVKYNATTGALVASFTFPGFINDPIDVAVSGNDMYVTIGNTVAEFDATTGTQNMAFTPPSGLQVAWGVAVSGSTVYVADAGNNVNTVFAFNATTGAAVPGFTCNSGLDNPRFIAVENNSAPVAPVISSLLSVTGTGNFGFEYQIQASGPPVSFTESGLPSELGLSLDPSTGLISGTPTETGTFSATISAINLAGTGSATLALVVVPPPVPVISSTLSATATNGLAFDYQIQATNYPASYYVLGLPPGLTWNASTGLIYGTPTESGTFGPIISAINLGGTGSQTLNLVVITPPPPMISSPLTATGTNGQPFSYQIIGSNVPTSFTATGLPAGLVPDDSTGLISGTPTQSGTFDATISAINTGGTDTETLVLTIEPLPPVITSGLTASGSNGAAFSYQIQASNGPASFAAAGLPPGLSVDPALGSITGTLAAGGVFPVTISATNGGGTGSATLTLTVLTGFRTLQGSYEGLGALGGTNEALFAITVGPAGGFTGKLVTPAATYPVNGIFTSYGTFSQIIDSGSAEAILSVDGAAPGVNGTILAAGAGAVATYSVESSPLGKFTAATLPKGLAGSYTVIIPALSGTNPALPPAPGYGTMYVGSKGLITLGGKLGDGTPLDVTGQLDADGKTWTLYQTLYAGRYPGSIAGTLTFGASAYSDCAGALDWVKPARITGQYYAAGFGLGVELMAAKYATPPLAAGTASITLSGGNLKNPASIIDDLAISSRDAVTVIGSNTGGVTVKLLPATGQFSGTFRNPALTGSTPFGGVIYQKPSPGGFGLFLGTNQSGAVSLSQ